MVGTQQILTEGVTEIVPLGREGWGVGVEFVLFTAGWGEAVFPAP